MKKDKDRVKRHSALVRLTHWLVALSGLVLVFTGMGELPMYKRYNVIKLPGLAWASDFELNLVIHYYAAAVFVFAVVFHVLYHLRRREFSIVPRKGDLKESIQIVKAMLTGGQEPAHEKFLAEQRLAYAAIGGAALVLMVTGLVKTYKNLGPVVLEPGFLGMVTLIHTAFTVIFVLLIVAHLGAFAIKANWPLLPSIFTGYVSRQYASQRHARWKP